MRTPAAAALFTCILAIAPRVSVEGQQPGQVVPAPATPPRAVPAKGTAVVKGQLVDAVSGKPIRRGRVTMGGPSMAMSADTDAEGRFEFRDVPAARYTLNASRAGYLPLQPRLGKPVLPPLEVADGATVDGVVLRLSKGGVITGHIVDEFGEPLPGAQLRAVRYRYVDGQRQLGSISQAGFVRPAITDDLGSFRVYGLDPGDYYVEAQPPNDFFNSPAGDGPTVTYYPGTIRIAEARLVTVRAGRETQGITFAMAVTRLARIRGRAMSSTGEPMSNGSITVTERDGSGTRSSGAGIRPDGSFEIGNLPPGTYLLTARINDGRQYQDAEVGRLLVSLNGEDVNDLLLVATTGGIARGRIVTDEGGPLPFTAGTLSVAALPADRRTPYQWRPDSPVRDDGTFEIKGLFDRMRIQNPGVIRSPGPVVQGWALKAVLLEGQDVTDTGIEFKPGRVVENIELVFTRRITRVMGTVSADREILSDTWVVLFAADESRWVPGSRWIRTTRPAFNGRYTLPAVPSDDYLIAAVAGLEDGQYEDPEFLRAVKDRATRVSVNEGETTTVQDLKIVEWRK